MFACSVKITRKRLTALVLFAGLILCALVLAAGWLHSRDQIRLPDEESRLSYIRSLGYTPEGPAETWEDVVIPEWFDASYASYNTQQKRAGFDLSRWRGQPAVLYTYVLTDYPGGEPRVLLHLLLWEDRLIGGDICSPTAGGFLHGLRPRQ